jgi:hypothetical protein
VGVSVEATLLQKNCDFINDLLEMFRSFRVKLSLTAKYRSKKQTCHLQESMQINRNGRGYFIEIHDHFVRGPSTVGLEMRTPGGAGLRPWLGGASCSQVSNLGEEVAHFAAECISDAYQIK